MRIKPNADGHSRSWSSAFLYRWPVGQAVKTAASHAANGSSILPRVTTSEWTTFHSKSPAIRLGFSHTISSFLLNPTKLCKTNFCGAPLPEADGHPGRMDCIPFKNSQMAELSSNYSRFSLRQEPQEVTQLWWGLLIYKINQ